MDFSFSTEQTGRSTYNLNGPSGVATGSTCPAARGFYSPLMAGQALPLSGVEFMRRALLSVVVIAIGTAILNGQPPSLDLTDGPGLAGSTGTVKYDRYTPTSQRPEEGEINSIGLYVFGGLILALTAMALGLVFWNMHKNRKGWDDLRSFQLFGLVFVLGVGTFLIVAGYSPAQTAPIYGLMGASLGYLFGRDTRQRSSGVGQQNAAGTPPPSNSLPASPSSSHQAPTQA